MRKNLSKIWVKKFTTKRLFLAIPVSPNWKPALESYTQTLHTLSSLQDIPVRWTTPSNYHITVRFIGNMEESCIPQLIRHMKVQIEHHPSFSLSFKTMEVATENEPKMIWVRFQKSQQFLSLVKSCTTFLSSFLKNECGGGLLPNGHDSIPHITLSRFNKSLHPKLILPPLLEIPKQIDVQTILLNESRTLPTGSVYRTLASFRLGANYR